MLKFSLITLGLLFVATAYAENTNHEAMWSFTNDHHYTTDNLRLITSKVSWVNQRKNMAYNYKSEKESFLSYGAHATSYNGHTASSKFTGTKFGLVIGKKFSSNLSLDIDLNMTKIEDTTNLNNKNFGAAKVSIEGYHVDKKLYYKIENEDALSFSYMALPAGIDSFTTQNKTSAKAQYIHNQKHKVALKVANTQFSDLNVKTESEFKYLYGISPGWPWIWFGVHTNQLKNSKNITGYWTPETFSSSGIRLESAYPLYKELSAYTEIQVNKIKEEANPEGNGQVLSFGLLLGSRDSLNFKLGILKIKSEQSGNLWEQESINFGINY